MYSVDSVQHFAVSHDAALFAARSSCFASRSRCALLAWHVAVLSPCSSCEMPAERKREKRMHQSGFCATLIIIPEEFATRMKAQITVRKHCGTKLDREHRQLGANKEQWSQVKFTEALCRKDVCYEATLAPSHSNFNCVYGDCYQRCV